jgi:hypothetical protein
MIPRVVCLILVLASAGPVWGQDNAPPQRLDELFMRASAFRRFLAAGDRVKASEYVVTSKRKDFLNKPASALDNVRPIGFDFVDKDHVLVRVTGQTVVSGGEGAQLTQPQIADLWVREKGAWYFEPASADVPFAAVFKKDAAADATALAEIKSSFKLLTQAIDVGEMWQGDRKELPVQFQYTGSSGIRIVSKIDTPVTMIDGASTRWITKESNHFQITAGSDDFDGPFDIPMTFTVYYKSVALDQSVRVKGSIRPVCKYRQAPETVPPDSKEEFRLFLTNNTDETAEFGAFETDGKFFVTNYPRRLEPAQEGVITLKRDQINGVKPGTVVSIALKKELQGKQLCEMRIR